MDQAQNQLEERREKNKIEKEEYSRQMKEKSAFMAQETIKSQDEIRTQSNIKKDSRTDLPPKAMKSVNFG